MPPTIDPVNVIGVVNIPEQMVVLATLVIVGVGFTQILKATGIP